MSFVQIPIPATEVAFDLQAEFETVGLNLSFIFYPRDNSWRVTISRDGIVLLAQVRVVNDPDLLSAHRYIEELPPGKFRVFDQEGFDSDPDGINFGDRVLMLYETSV